MRFPLIKLAVSVRDDAGGLSPESESNAGPRLDRDYRSVIDGRTQRLMLPTSTQCVMEVADDFLGRLSARRSLDACRCVYKQLGYVQTESQARPM